jgi:hypothetical protein
MSDASSDKLFQGGCANALEPELTCVGFKEPADAGFGSIAPDFSLSDRKKLTNTHLVCINATSTANTLSYRHHLTENILAGNFTFKDYSTASLSYP